MLSHPPPPTSSYYGLTTVNLSVRILFCPWGARSNPGTGHMPTTRPGYPLAATRDPMTRRVLPGCSVVAHCPIASRRSRPSGVAVNVVVTRSSATMTSLLFAFRTAKPVFSPSGTDDGTVTSSPFRDWKVSSCGVVFTRIRPSTTTEQASKFFIGQILLSYLNGIVQLPEPLDLTTVILYALKRYYIKKNASFCQHSLYI